MNDTQATFDGMTDQRIADRICELFDEQEKARAANDTMETNLLSAQIHNANVELSRRARQKYNKRDELSAICDLFENEFGVERAARDMAEMQPRDFAGYYDDILLTQPAAYSRLLVSHSAAWDVELL